MRKKTLRIAKCIDHCKGFMYGKYYYQVGNGKFQGSGLYVNERGLLESEFKETMEVTQVLSELFPVVYIVNNQEIAPLLITDEEYSVFNVDTIDNIVYYTIFGQSYKMEKYPADLFLHLDEYTKLQSECIKCINVN